MSRSTVKVSWTINTVVERDLPHFAKGPESCYYLDGDVGHDEIGVPLYKLPQVGQSNDTGADR